jgi:hypothetical protein
LVGSITHSLLRIYMNTTDHELAKHF